MMQLMIAIVTPHAQYWPRNAVPTMTNTTAHAVKMASKVRIVNRGSSIEDLLIPCDFRTARRLRKSRSCFRDCGAANACGPPANWRHALFARRGKILPRFSNDYWPYLPVAIRAV